MMPLERAEMIEPDRRRIKQFAREHGKSMNQIRQMFNEVHRTNEVYMNDVYMVHVETVESEWGKLIWLSIKRLDKESIHDWRDLQEIKNQLVGPENEGVELYPAESRRVDTANQYHLFVLADSEVRFPFGYTERSVMDGDGDIGRDGTRQRPL
jgi:hypothetical protein